eukprot:Protomagalhaensia_wolfi_Nauph_80__3856@NODE_3907_length_681_cov_60_267913_g3090_i0_p1_GENE_NODE_3907_length_681_cov_60_267913_g3090_i0NODE_3907_length_681_cov_60_267913_g3090_i0_p1_ORF_typecomplete_len167_score26_98_NODE_3907_length_681_cov_60_267913_g3090_i0130630
MRPLVDDGHHVDLHWAAIAVLAAKNQSLIYNDAPANLGGWLLNDSSPSSTTENKDIVKEDKDTKLPPKAKRPFYKKPFEWLLRSERKAEKKMEKEEMRIAARTQLGKIEVSEDTGVSDTYIPPDAESLARRNAALTHLVMSALKEVPSHKDSQNDSVVSLHPALRT